MKKIEFIERYGEEAYQRRLEQRKKYYQQHKEELKEYHKQYFQQHKEETRQHQKQYNRQHNQMFVFCIKEQIEQIENYQFAKKDNFDGWCIHHRLETHNSDGEKRLVNLSRTELIALDMYYNRPANELVFLTKSEHAKLHKK